MSKSNPRQKQPIQASRENRKAKPKSRNGLTGKELIFCAEYVRNGWNGSQAAISAGYAEGSARQEAQRMLTKVYIRERIEYHKTHTEELLNISRERIIKEHLKMALSSIAHLHNTWIERKEFESLTDDQKECIQEISTSIQKKNIGTAKHPEIVDVEYIKIKLYDKQKSLDSISKIMGYDAPIKMVVDDNRKNVSELFPPIETIREKAANVKSLDKP